MVSLASPAAERGSWIATMVPAVVGGAFGGVLTAIAVAHGVTPLHGITIIVTTAIITPALRILIRRRDRPRVDVDVAELVFGTHRIPPTSLVAASAVHGLRQTSLDVIEFEVGEHRIALAGERWAMRPRQRDALARVLERSSIRVPTASAARAMGLDSDAGESAQPLSRDEAVALVRRLRALGDGDAGAVSPS